VELSTSDNSLPRCALISLYLYNFGSEHITSEYLAPDLADLPPKFPFGEL